MIPTRIRVLMITGSLAGGGAERVTSTLLGRLDRSRFELGLALLRNRIEYPVPEDVECLLPASSVDGQEPLASVARRRPWVLAQAMRALSRQIDAFQPDVVLSNIDQVNCVTRLALRGGGVRPAWIARVGNNPDFESRLLRPLRWHVYRQANRVVANSQQLGQAVSRFYRLPAERVQTIGNPTDFAAIRTAAVQEIAEPWPGDEPLLVSVGRLVRQKRFDLLIDAVARVRRHTPVRLAICGDGPLRESLERQIARERLTAAVRLLGHCDNPYPWMQAATLFVLSSDHEGLPNALIEAQGLGIPAVATCCRYGPEEIVRHGITGLLTPVGDASGLSAAIWRLLVDPAGRAGMARQAVQSTLPAFDAQTVVGQWEELIEQQACGDRGLSRAA